MKTTPPTDHLPAFTIFHVFGESELESATRDGWVLHETYDVHVPMPIQQPMYEPHYNRNGCDYGGNHVSVNCTALGLMRRFLMTRSVDNPIPELKQQIETLTTREIDLNKQFAERVGAIDQLNAKLERTGSTHDLLVAELKNQLKQATDTKHKLGGDIAKIRTEIGDARMRDILGH